MVETALTQAQQTFAADHHSLVYAFLNEKKLPDDDFYDIVVFGYLRAVKRYFDETDLANKYAFSTIAWGAMKTCLANHYQSESRQKRKAYVISLDADVFVDGEKLLYQEVVSATDTHMQDLETELLLLELASKVSKREMDVIRMKAEGFGTREIAKAQRMPMKSVTEMLAGLRNTVLAVCHE